MHRVLPLPLLLGLAAGCTAPGPRPAAPPATLPATQLVVVTTSGWDATVARLQRYERDAAGAPWRPVGGAVPANVGRTGLAWGSGLHPAAQVGGEPHKREGDGKAPAGVFRLSSAFGYAPAAEAAWVRLPYVATDASVECVDDSRSRHYNRRVDRDTIPAPDWTSHEELRRQDGLYAWGVWVDHNSDPPRPGGGSCIFLHVWGGPGVATTGCTSFAEAELRTVLAWLDPRANPMLVQLPEPVYHRVRRAWELP